MTTERLKYEGHLAVLEKEAAKLKIQIEGVVKSLRENLDPLERPEKLAAKLIVQQVLDLADKHATYKVILADMEKAKEILGREKKIPYSPVDG